METRVTVWVPPWCSDRRIKQCLIICPRNELPLVHKLVQPSHLTQPQSRMYVGHSIVVTKIDLLVVPGAIGWVSHFCGIAADTMAAEPHHLPGKRGVIGQCHTAFSRRYNLDRMKAKNG